MVVWADFEPLYCHIDNGYKTVVLFPIFYIWSILISTARCPLCPWSLLHQDASRKSYIGLPTYWFCYCTWSLIPQEISFLHNPWISSIFSVVALMIAPWCCSCCRLFFSCYGFLAHFFVEHPWSKCRGHCSFWQDLKILVLFFDLGRVLSNPPPLPLGRNSCYTESCHRINPSRCSSSRIPDLQLTVSCLQLSCPILVGEHFYSFLCAQAL